MQLLSFGSGQEALEACAGHQVEEARYTTVAAPPFGYNAATPGQVPRQRSKVLQHMENGTWWRNTWQHFKPHF